jgi:transposase-like protein
MNLTDPIYSDENKAREHLEAIRWPNGPVCPHCGECENVGKLEGKSHRPGLNKCYSCSGHFTVTIGTVFERSKIPLNKWIYAAHVMASSKKGFSAHQLHRTIEVTYKTAWFMMHRLREAMDAMKPGPMGSGGGTVEADETFWGNNKRSKKAGGYTGRGYEHKMKVFSLVERGGEVRSFHVPAVNAATLKPIVQAQLAKDAHLMTDELVVYQPIGKDFASHEVVKHSKLEFSRGNAHTNTVEGYFSILKRGLIGTYHHVGEQHLKRYIAEFDFRYNTRASLGVDDKQRARMLLKATEGKRLMYR